MNDRLLKELLCDLPQSAVNQQRKVNMNDERNLGCCCICERDQYPNQVTNYSADATGEPSMVVCHDCIELFEHDEGVKVESDVMGAELFAKLACYARLECQPDPIGRINKIEIFRRDGQRMTATFKGSKVYLFDSQIGEFECGVDDFLKGLRRDILGHARNQSLKQAKLAPAELRVSESLCQDGIAASYEFPGYVSIHHKGALYAFGTADDYWSGHGLEVSGETCEPFLSSQIPSSVVEPEDITSVVAWIKDCLKFPGAKH
jgi:hypothetical protein